jgi:N-acetylglucosaminyldiphosphoundecaprenol N-acetyl-beta-D-mannosaminyltransferase
MSKQSVYDKIGILGVDIDVLGSGEAIDYICQLAVARQQPAAYVVKPYVEFLVAAAGNPDLQDLLNGAELAIADGIAVVWAAHFLYAGSRSTLRFLQTLCQIIISPEALNWPIPDRAAGTNFTWPLLKAAAAHNLRVYIIGKQSLDQINQVSKAISRQIPDITIVGAMPGHDLASKYGHVSASWLKDSTHLIAESKADLILVGMGFPLQEHVANHLAANLSHGVAIGEGGTFDYESFGGSRPKAPARIQRLGLEWLWRLMKEPKRVRRQFAIPRFLYLIWIARR